MLFETAPEICYQDGVLYYIKREVKVDEKGSRTQKWEKTVNTATIKNGNLTEIAKDVDKEIIRSGIGLNKCIVVNKSELEDKEQKTIYKDSVCTGNKYNCTVRLEDFGVTVYLSDEYRKNVLNYKYIKKLKLYAVYDNGDEKLVSGELARKILLSYYFPYKNIYFYNDNYGKGIIDPDLESREITSPVAAYSKVNPHGWHGEVYWVKPGIIMQRNLIRRLDSRYQNTEIYLIDIGGKSILLSVGVIGSGDAKISSDGCVFSFYSHYSEPRTMKTTRSFKFINFCK